MGRMSKRSTAAYECSKINQRQSQALLALILNGQQAVKPVVDEGHHFDIVPMDAQMPKLDGVQATRIIREHPKTKLVPILCVSAKATGRAVRGRQTGPCDRVERERSGPRQHVLVYAADG
jgi:CheY-like chemotaxis protein